jgi:hypothetical protein
METTDRWSSKHEPDAQKAGRIPVPASIQAKKRQKDWGASRWSICDPGVRLRFHPSLPGESRPRENSSKRAINEAKVPNVYSVSGKHSHRP